MAKNLNLLDKNIINTIVSELEGSEEDERKIHSFDSWQIYSGNQDPYVSESIKAQRPRSYKSYTVSDISISKMICDKKSRAYKQQPIRYIEDGSDNKNERLEGIFKEGGAIRQMPYFDSITNLHKYSLMWVNYLVEEEKYNFMSLQPHEFSVIRCKKTGALLAVILNYPDSSLTHGAQTGDGVDGLLAESQADSSAQSKVYRIWSNDNFVTIRVETNEIKTAFGVKVEKSVTYLSNPENPNNINVLGRIPFVFVSQELAIDYPTLSPIGSQSTKFGTMMSELITSATMQGASTLTFEYPAHMAGQFDKIASGLTDVIELPQSSKEEDSPTRAAYISPSPDLVGQKDSYMTYLEGVLAQHGLNIGQAMSRNVEASASGIALAIKNANIGDIIDMNQQVYVQVEKEMFEIIKSWETYIGSSIFDVTDILHVTFKKPKVLISDKEVLDNIKLRMELGLMRKYEALMELDPNLSESDAKKEIEDIDKEKQDNMSKVMNGFISQTNQNSNTGLIASAEKPPFTN